MPEHCTATKKDGTPCTGRAIGDTGLCLAHQPRSAKVRQPKAASVKPNAGGAVGAAAAAVSGGYDPEAQARLHAALAGVVGMCCIMLPMAYRPYQQEVDAILLPLERIWLRHAPGVGEINEDITDALASVVGVMSFVGRVYLVPRLTNRNATVDAGSDAGAVNGATPGPQRSADTPAPIAHANGQQPTPFGAHRTIEDVLSNIHSTSVHASGDGRGDDAYDVAL